MPRLETENKRIKSAQIKIKAFLHRQSWKEVLIFFLFLLLSLGFWVLQSMNEEYEIEITIPVRYKDIPADVAFAQPPPKDIVISVKDKGNVLLNYSIGRTISPIEVDYKKALDKDKVLNVSQQEIEAHLMKQLFTTTQLHRFTPSSIEVQTSKKKLKKVPVVFNGSVIPSDGYGLADKISISPTSINVYSTQNVLDSISEVRTGYIDIKNIKKSITRNLALEPISGATFEQTNVAVSIQVEEFTEKTLDIPIVCTDIPARHIVRIFPPSVAVNCNVPMSKYKNLKEGSFSIRIKYEDLEQHISGSIPIKLIDKPDWIQTYTLVPNKVEFIIEQSITHD